MTDPLNVEKRDQTGTLRMRRLRASGRIPAILYGHGESNINLHADARDVEKLVRESHHVIELSGAVSESALVKDVQWDALGVDILHFDLARIDATEMVEVELAIELRGVAPGTREGGIVRHLVHEVTLKCPANKLPDVLAVSINDLHLNGTVTAANLPIPAEAELLLEPDTIIVTCELPVVVEEPVADVDAAAEPEVIGRKEEGDESAEDDKD